MSQMSHESSYESVSGFSPKVRIRVRYRVWIRAGVGVRVTGVFLRMLKILTHDLLTRLTSPNFLASRNVEE